MNVIIIPAYNPNYHLLKLVKDLKALTDLPIVIVNDGSKEESNYVFELSRRNGCHIVTHTSNKGKGAALKSGLMYSKSTFPNVQGYITCDADGQHLATDIIQISKSLDEHPGSLILGSRDFSTDDVPTKSRLGNQFSAVFFKLSTGVSVSDTQTGLRGIPVKLTSFALDFEENRYDYEMSFLMETAKAGINIIEVPIETVYLDNNSASHFRPVVDSIRIYKRPLKFLVSSLSSALIDITIFTILSSILSNEIAVLVFIATVTARVLSGLYNYTLNRVWSFKSFSPVRKQFPKYFILYIIQLLLSIGFVTILSVLPVHLTVVKIVVDTFLFIGSYFIQKNWVFKTKKDILES